MFLCSSCTWILLQDYKNNFYWLLKSNVKNTKFIGHLVIFQETVPVKQICFKEIWKILTVFSGIVHKILNLQISFYWNILFKRNLDIYFEPSQAYWHVVV